MRSETSNPANVNAEALAILNCYVDMVKHPVKALALLRDKVYILFLLLQLTEEDEEIVGLTLRILYAWTTSLGHHRGELAETFGYRNSIELVIKRFYKNEAYMTFCKHLLDIAPKSTATGKRRLKTVTVYFYEPVNHSAREGLTSGLTSMKGIVSVAFNMAAWVCKLRMTKEVKKDELVQVLISSGVHCAVLGLCRGGKEQRIAVGRKEEETRNLPGHLSVDYVRSPGKRNSGQHVYMPLAGTSGFQSIWKGVTSLLDAYF